jgi:hypothetical protein
VAHDPPTTEPPAAPPAAPKSLREVAEDAYDEVLDDSSAEGQEQGAVDEAGRQRDARGRFAKAEPGEAEAQPPSPETKPASAQEPHPAPEQPPGRAAEAPQNWSAADRETFAKQTPEAQQFLLRRHSEMEGDYQRRVQANATAAQFTQSLGPIFSDPVIGQSLQQSNLSPFEAIVEWASMHRRAMSPNVQDRVQLLAEIGQRMGLDPAAVFGQSRPGQQPQLSEQDLQDPAIRFFADHVSRTVQDVQALRGQIVAMQRQEADRTAAETMKVTRWGIDSFAEEKGPDGQLLRPDFDAVLPQIIELFNADPTRDLRQAYEQARWLNAETRKKLIDAERNSVQRQISDTRAKQAVRVNARGVTSPVSKPADKPGSKSLRDTLNEAADEVGFGS